MIDRILEPYDYLAYDYSRKGNLLDYNALETFMENTKNKLIYELIPLIIKMHLVILVWYPYYREHFGWCWGCVFTLFGFVERESPWYKRDIPYVHDDTMNDFP